MLNTNKPDLMGTFKLLVKKDPFCAKIIDGQHRYFALQQIIDNDTRFNLDVVLEIYYVDDLDGPEAWSLFYKANNVLNIQEKDKTASSSSFVCTNLHREFPLAVRDPKGKSNRVNFPNVDRKALFERLKKSDIFDVYTKEQVYNAIIKKNLELSKKSIKEFTSIVPANKKERIETGYRRCCKTGCFLGLHLGGNRFDWFREIEIEARKD